MIWPDPLVGGGIVVGPNWHHCPVSVQSSITIELACEQMGFNGGAFVSPHFLSQGGHYVHQDLTSLEGKVGNSRYYSCQQGDHEFTSCEWHVYDWHECFDYTGDFEGGILSCNPYSE